MPWALILNVVLLGAEVILKRMGVKAAVLADFYRFVHSVDVNHLSGVSAGKAWRAQALALAEELDRRAKEQADGMVTLPGKP